MRDQRPAIVQIEKQVFSTPMDIVYPSVLQPPRKNCRFGLRSQTFKQKPGSNYLPPRNKRVQRSCNVFYLGQFGHTESNSRIIRKRCLVAKDRSFANDCVAPNMTSV